MPFARKNSYRRYNRKRSYNRYKRTFSRYNTYRNRSSVAQASQIYKLNRRISRIESNTKPEYLEYMPDAVGSQLSLPLATNDWSELNKLHLTDGTVSSSNPPAASGFAGKIRDSIARVLKVIVWGALERNPEAIATSSYREEQMSCGYVRIAVVQYLAEKYVDVNTSNIFEMGDGPTGFTAPLKKGCGTEGRIIKVINLKISSQDPLTKNFKYVIKPKNKIVRKTYKVDGSLTPSQRMKGGIVLCPIGFHEKNNDTENTTYHLTLKAKVIYTDA